MPCLPPDLHSTNTTLRRITTRSARYAHCRAYTEAEETDRRRTLERQAAAAAAAHSAAEEARRVAAEAHAADEAKELADAISLSRVLTSESNLEAAKRRLEAHPEPPATRPGVGAPSTTNIRVTLPSGTKLQRRFETTDTVSTLRDFVFVAAHALSEGDAVASSSSAAAAAAGSAAAGSSEVISPRSALLLDPDTFELTCSYPRRVFTASAADGALDMKAAGLAPQAVLFVTMKHPPPPPPPSGTGADALDSSDGSAASRG